MALCTVAVAASAATTWTLQGVTFSDGGTASGSFVYDAATNTYSNINVTTTAGTVVLTGANYQFAVAASSASGVGLVTTAGNLTGTRGLALLFTSLLTGNGGTVNISNTSMELTCNNASCSNNTTLRTVTAGRVIGVNPTPTLSEWGLIAFAVMLAGLGALRLRKFDFTGTTA